MRNRLEVQIGQATWVCKAEGRCPQEIGLGQRPKTLFKQPNPIQTHQG